MSALNAYYIGENLKKADLFWKEEKYRDALRLYEDNECNLSSLQRKRVEYLRKRMEGKN